MATIQLAGTVLGLVLGMASMMWVLGVRDPRWLVGLPIGIATAIHLLFVTFLGAKLPRGPVEQLIAMLFGSGA